MKKLFYLRHGLSELNKSYLICGSTDCQLADEGRIGATKEGELFKAKSIQIDKIYASPLIRAYDTAVLFAKAAGINPGVIVKDNLLAERNFGVLENTPYDPNVTMNLMNDDLPEGVEKWDDLVKRAEQIFKKAEADSGNVLFVAHGSLGRALKQYLNDHPEYPHSHDWQERIPNSTIVELI